MMTGSQFTILSWWRRANGSASAASEDALPASSAILQDGPMSPQSKACPFCNSATIRQIFAETDNFVARYNIAPIVPGHSLVVPKRHLSGLFDLPEGIFCEHWVFAKQVTQFLLDELRTDAFDWIVQEQEAAGQTVPHLHLHIIPRKLNDLPEPGDWFTRLHESSESEVIDSASRERLSPEEHEQIASELARKWKEWKNVSDGT
jgi:bis(5'-adenosyl)-triphosphatase